MPDLFLTIPDDPPDRVDKALAQAAPDDAALSRSRLAKLIADGAVHGPAGPVRDGKARATAGETYRIALGDPAPVETLPEAIPLAVVYEDDELIVIDKPAGMVVHPAPGSPSGTLVNALLAHCAGSLSGIGGEARPGIVHRIDKDTSGLLVAAKSDRAHQGLARQFADHSAARRYLALAHGTIDPADPRLRGLPGVAFEPGGVLRITTKLGRHPTDRQRQAVSFERGRHAVTRARMLERFGAPPSAMLVECRLETGRTHQIRVHAQHIGHPVAGDDKYGDPEVNRRLREQIGLKRLALHAASMEFALEGGSVPYVLHAPLAPELATALDALAG